MYVCMYVCMYGCMYGCMDVWMVLEFGGSGGDFRYSKASGSVDVDVDAAIASSVLVVTYSTY